MAARETPPTRRAASYAYLNHLDVDFGASPRLKPAAQSYLDVFLR